MANENSVLFALNELQTIEAERMDQEAKMAQQAILDAEAKREALAQAELEAASQRQAVAEAEARLRLDAETAAKERAERIARLQAELSSVQNDRARLHQLALTAGSATPPPARRSPWPMAFAAVSALAMALSAWIIVRTPEVQVREVLVPTPVIEAPVAPPAEVVAPEVVVAPVEEIAPAVEEAAPARVRPRVRPRSPVRTNGLEGLDHCDDDDPLCGI